MGLFSREGKSSGVCRDCKMLKNSNNDCKCTANDGKASCTGCGAKGYVPNRDAHPDEIRSQIGCSCGSEEN